MAERRTVNALVAGSSPALGANMPVWVNYCIGLTVILGNYRI